jgi:hypothetical protein
LAAVIALAHGPLSDHEALVMYATAVHGTPRCDLPAITGLSELDVQQALAQLVRRGLIRTTHRTTSTHRKESTVLETDHSTPQTTLTPTRLDARTSRADVLDRLDLLARHVIPPTLWCIQYAAGETRQARRALDGVIHYIDRDGSHEPRVGDLAFAGWDGPTTLLPRQQWTSEQRLTLLVYGRITRWEPHILEVCHFTACSRVSPHELNEVVRDRLMYSAANRTERGPRLLCAIGQPEPNAL